MSRIKGDWLKNDAAQVIFAMLENAGYQAYAVGGCIRNALLEIAVNDIDITTDAHPETVAKLARKAGLNPVPTGIEHGTITVVSSGTGYEVTTFRKDVETDGRRAVVAFASTLEEDAHRRDFTMNALYATADGTIIDPLDGLADLTARKVRFIDNAHDRIREDYLRILRFFRFHAWFGDPANGIDPDALAACAALADGLTSLSKERIGAEMHRLLAAPDPAPSVAAMEASGILTRILPGATGVALAPLVHHEEASDINPNWIRRLACLGGQDHKECLRLSKAENKRLLLYLAQFGEGSTPAELAYRHGAEAAYDIALLRAASLAGPLPEDLGATVEYAAKQVFPIRARDFGDEIKGPAISARLNELETRWISSGFTLSKQQLLT